MTSEENLQFMREGGPRYIVGTPKSGLKRFERELLSGDWELVREGLEVKLCPSPEGDETFILCRSRDRSEKERAIHARFEARIEEGLERIARGCQGKRCSKSSLERRVGALLHSNSRAAGLFSVRVEAAAGGGFEVTWRKDEARRAWWELADGCYMLRSNVTEWSAEELWRAYVQLTEAEAAFRIEKNDLRVRPVWHQKAERVRAHILVCFLTLVAWKTLAELCSAAGLGDEPRRVFEELSQIKIVDVVLRTRTGTAIRRRCVTQPTKPQAALLSRLHLRLPQQMRLPSELAPFTPPTAPSG